MAPTYLTLNSAQVSDTALPEGSTWSATSQGHKCTRMSFNMFQWGLTWALGGVLIETGDCAWPRQASQTGINWLDKGSLEFIVTFVGNRTQQTEWLNSNNNVIYSFYTSQKWANGKSANICFRRMYLMTAGKPTLLLVLTSLLWELLLLWRFLPIRNILHHDASAAGLQLTSKWQQSLRRLAALVLFQII